jgi:perosamine synthetase
MTRRYPLARPDLSGSEEAYVVRAIRAHTISSVGPEVEAFESAFSRAVDVPHAVAVSSGTAALHLALSALGIGVGDEVIVPDLTYVATANTVRYTGARVVLVDVDAASWTVDVAAVERALTARTKAVIAVHLYGTPCAIDALRALARRRRVALIEDAAQALGARWRGRPVGGWGDVGCFSFYGNKVITTGEGGMVVTRSAAIARRLRDLRGQATLGRPRYFHHAIGFNYRMTALQAGIGLAQLERLGAFIEKRAQIADWYRAALAPLPGWVEPIADPLARRTNWLFTVHFPGWTRRRRDHVITQLAALGVDSRPAFVPMSQLPMYRQRGLARARRLAAGALSLPTYTGLRARDVRAIVATLRRVIARRRR